MTTHVSFFNLRRAIWRSIALLALLLVAYVLVGRQLTPMVERTVPTVESYLSDVLEQPVSIDRIQGDWRGFGPVFTVRGLRIGDSFGLDNVLLEPALLMSLVNQSAIFNRFQVNGGQIRVEHDGERWQVPAFAILERDVQLRDVFVGLYNQLLEQDAIQLHDLSLTLESEDLALELRLADALIIGTHEYHELSGELVLDPTGQAVSAGLQIEARNTREAPDIQAYLRHDALDFSRFIGALPDTVDARLSSLEVAAHWWLQWRDGGIASLQADVQRADLGFQAGTDATPQVLEGFSGAVLWEPDDGRHHLKLRDISFRYNDLNWMPSSHDIWYGPDGLAVDTSLLSIAPLGAMVGPWLPRDIFAQHGIRGQVHNLSLGLPRTDNGDWDFERVQLSGEIRDGEFGTLGFIPGFDRADLRFTAGLRKGVLELEPGPLTVDLSSLLPEPIEMDVHSGTVVWNLSTDMKLQIASSEIDFDWRDSGRAQGRFAFSGSMDGTGEAVAEPIFSLALAGDELHTDSLLGALPIALDPAILDWMQTHLHDVIARDWALILPNVMAPDVRTRIGMMGARVDSTRITLDGDWPAFEQLGGDFYLDHEGISASLESGRYAGLWLEEGQLSLPFAGPGPPAVNVSAAARGLGSDGWRLVTQTPVRDLVPAEVLNWQMAGSVSGDLDLRIPLAEEPVDLDLAMRIQDGLLRMPDLNLTFSAINGPVFLSTRNGLRSPGLEGQLFDAPLSTAIQTSVDQDDNWRLEFPAHGRMPLDRLGDWLDEPWLSTQATEVNYSGLVAVSGGRLQLQAQSDLYGLELDLPPPFAKQADQRAPLALSIQLEDDERYLDVTLDDWLDLQLVTDPAGSPERGVLSLGGATGARAAMPADHLRLDLQMDDVDLAEWMDLAAELMPLYRRQEQLDEPDWVADMDLAEIPVAEDGLALLDTVAEEADFDAHEDGVRPLLAELNTLRLHDIRLSAASMRFNDTALDGGLLHLRRADAGWTADVDSRRLAGRLTLPDDADAAGLLALNYLHLGNPDAVELPSEIDDAVPLDEAVITVAEARRPREPYTYNPDTDWLAGFDPSWLPELELRIDDLTHDAESFGNWSFVLLPRANGLAIEDLEGELREVVLTGSVDWSIPEEGWHSTRTRLQANAGDLADVLVASSLTPVITSNRAQGWADLEWWGSPLAFDGRGLRGQVGFDLRDGSLVELDDFDAVRVIGLLNVTRILRRLSLDFRDVFSAGISYDRIRGELEVEQGLITVGDRLSLDGSGARMFFGGEYDILQDELDAEGVIIARVSNTAGLLALGAGFSPPVALMVIFGERALERELERLFSVRTQISGPLARPDVRASRLFDSDIRGNEATLEERMRELFGPDAR